MIISNEKKLKDLQQEFNRKFPYLKLVFFGSKHGFGVASDEADELNPDLLIADIRTYDTTGHVPLDGKQKVGEFEQHFQKAFGINVQVYRKSYGKWLQTWATDMWTLDEQNHRGSIMGDRSLNEEIRA